MTMNVMMNYVMLSEISFLALRNTFSSFVENENVEAYIQSMRQDGEYGGEIEIIAFSMMLQISIWINNQ